MQTTPTESLVFLGFEGTDIAEELPPQIGLLSQHPQGLNFKVTNVNILHTTALSGLLFHSPAHDSHVIPGFSSNPKEPGQFGILVRSAPARSVSLKAWDNILQAGPLQEIPIADYVAMYLRRMMTQEGSWESMQSGAQVRWLYRSIKETMQVTHQILDMSELKQDPADDIGAMYIYYMRLLFADDSELHLHPDDPMPGISIPMRDEDQEIIIAALNRCPLQEGLFSQLVTQ